jgi:hypothetical protein
VGYYPVELDAAPESAAGVHPRLGFHSFCAKRTGFSTAAYAFNRPKGAPPGQVRWEPPKEEEPAPSVATSPPTDDADEGFFSSVTRRVRGLFD